MAKRILIVTECFYPEEFKINDVAVSWKEKGFEVDVLTSTPTYPVGKVFPGYVNRLFQKDVYQGVNIFRVYAVIGYRSSPVKKILRYVNFMILGCVTSIFIGRRYDYVLGFNTGALTSMLPAVVMKKIYRKPITFWSQDIWPDSVYAYGFKKTKLLSYGLNVFVKFMYRNVESIAISSRGFESRLRSYARKGLVFHYLPNWSDDLNMNLSPFKFSDDPKTHFTFAGNIGSAQNLDNVIAAFNRMDEKYLQKAQLNIIGSGSALSSLKNLDTGNGVFFYGNQPREEMAKYYKASNFLIVSLADSPAFEATIPAKIQTYIAAKKPILAFVNGDAANFVESNMIGLCAHPSHQEEMTSLFMKCIDMPSEEREKFSENFHLLNDKFDKDRIIDKLLSLVTRSA